MSKLHSWTLVLALLTIAGALATLAAAPPNLDKAVEAQIERARANPDDPRTANDLGNLLLLVGRIDEAEDAYRRATEIDPRALAPHYNLGLLLQQRNERRKALRQFKKVIDLEPDHAWAHFQIGAIHEAAGDERSAVHFYGEAFALDPSLASSHVNPQVIDSKLVTVAMLRGLGKAAPAPLAPKRYEEGHRIARVMMWDLLEPPSAAEEAGAVRAAAGNAEDTGKFAGEEKGTPGGRGKSAAQAEPDQAASRRVLTPDNIERGSNLGQVVAPGTPRSSPGRTGSGRAGTPSTGGVPRGYEPPSDTTVRSRPGRLRYVPSVRSTGSLDLELRFPEAAPAPAG